MSHVRLVALCITFASGACAQRDDPASDAGLKVEMAAMATDPRCVDTQRPVLLKVTNNADRPLNKVTYLVEVRRRGHSDVIYQTTYTDDTIVAPNDQFGICIEQFAGLKRDVPSTATVEQVVASGRLNRTPPDEIEYEVRPVDPVFG